MLATDAYLGSQSVLAVLLGDKYAMTDIKNAVHLLRRFGANAHVWLPGVGSLNGLQTANYLLSDGSTGYAPADQYAGRVNDALGAVSSTELVINSGPFSNTSNWTSSNATVTAVGGEMMVQASGFSYGQSLQMIPVVAGKSYQIDFSARIGTATNGWLLVGSSPSANDFCTQPINASSRQSIVQPTTNQLWITCQTDITVDNGSVYFGAVHVKEITGIHLVQGTTANKPQLKLVGNSYRWVFDATDFLSCTIPAGYEAATTIDAKSTGQVTLQGQNIVGTYSIGPNLTTSGRIVLKDAPSASDLVILENLANRLAGL